MKMHGDTWIKLLRTVQDEIDVPKIIEHLPDSIALGDMTFVFYSMDSWEILYCTIYHNKEITLKIDKIAETVQIDIR